jgi:predicted O-methyltransferase YrrM
MRWFRGSAGAAEQPRIRSRADVSDRLAHPDPAVLGLVETAPVWMTPAERLLLFTLAFTLRPARYLEIGTLHGGSALLVCTAMDSAGNGGTLVCIDPEPKIAPETWARLHHRTKLLRGLSPHALPEARSLAGGLFDLVLIDGDHTGAGVIRDATGVLSVAAPGAYLLFHDCFNEDVAGGIDAFVRQNAGHVQDVGPLTREITHEAGPDGAPAVWGGLRLAIVS